MPVDVEEGGGVKEVVRPGLSLATRLEEGGGVKDAVRHELSLVTRVDVL